MCDRAHAIFEHVCQELRDAFDIKEEQTGADNQAVMIGTNAKYTAKQLLTCAQELQVGMSAAYVGTECKTATQAFVVVGGETNRLEHARPVAVLFVNHEHTPEKLAPLLTAISKLMWDYGYHDAVAHCADGEFEPMFRNDSEGGHTRACTRFSQWTACTERTSAEPKEALLQRLPEQFAAR